LNDKSNKVEKVVPAVKKEAEKPKEEEIKDIDIVALAGKISNIGLMETSAK